MVKVGISTMRVFGPLAVISGFAIASGLLPTPSSTFRYAILTADVMVIAFWVLDEINNFKNNKTKN